MAKALSPAPPRQTVHSVFPSTAFRSSSSSGFRSLSLSPAWPSGIVSSEVPGPFPEFQAFRNLLSFPSSETDESIAPSLS